LSYVLARALTFIRPEDQHVFVFTAIENVVVRCAAAVSGGGDGGGD
jgi:hypothetical protein